MTKKNSKRIVIGIDPGYGRCGWTILEEEKKEIKLAACDCIETNSKHKLPERLAEIADALIYIIKKYKPTEMAIESLFWFKNQKTAMSVAQARGAIILTAQNNGLEIAEYTPLQVKQTVVGYGKATKSQISLMLRAHLKGQYTPIQDDTADAVAIGLTHLQTVRYDLPKAPEIDTNDTQKRYLTKQIVYKELSYQINGILFEAFKKLGGLLQERFYYSYLKDIFKEKNIQYNFQKLIQIDNSKCRYFIDFLIENKIVLEIKSTERFVKRDIDQVMNYLRQGGWELAILARFGKNGVVLQRLLRGK